jgi:sec-independent protein translocase protein TatA
MLTNSMFLILGLGGPEIALIMFAMLLLFGAKKIPELARGLGKGIREFKDATKDVKNEIDKSLDENN